jgi:type II restriction enzyme
MKKDFKNFIETLNDEIFTWEYFVDFEKAKKNSFKLKIQLNILNALLGENDFDKKFIEIAQQYPEVREAFPILIASRLKKFKEIKIVDTISLKSLNRTYLFNSKVPLSEIQKEDLLCFMKESGLKEIFENKSVSSLEDYVFGVEVGMDSHARKNRSGDLMENIVDKILDSYCKRYNNFVYLSQATSKKIKEQLNRDVSIDKNDRIFDFALLDKGRQKLYLIEVNLYGGGGTKLKSVAGEFEKVNNYILGQNIDFIWVTDGAGWRTAENPLIEAYENNKYTFNLKMFKEFLEEIKE